jgi:alpha-tubulin suppressor-like RCC1 family protein
LVITDDGSIISWGNNENGQLGDSSLISKPYPVYVINDGILKGLKIIEVEAGFG